MIRQAYASAHRVLLLAATGAAISGCAVPASDYRRPELVLPAASASVSASTSTTALAQWWKALNDPVLDALVLEAQHNNQDLAVAFARVDEARALAGVIRASSQPVLDASLGSIRYPTQDTAVGGPRLRGNGPSDEAAGYQLAIVASYELDVWGKIRDANHAARTRLLAQEANRAVVQIGLQVAVVQTYVRLRALDVQLVIAQAGKVARAAALRLQRKRAELGAIDTVELYRAEAELGSAEIAATQVQRAIATTESALAVLLGRPPAAISAPDIPRGADIATLYQQVRLPAELPSDLLVRRPDILAAEHILIAANADVGQARAAFFPSVKLEVALNSAGELASPSALLWNLGSSMLQPLFRGGALQAGLAGAQARQTQAQASYVQAVQNAFRDLHDALIDFHTSQKIVTAAQRRAAEMDDSLRLASLSYRLGRTAEQDLLAVKSSQLQTQAAVIDAQRTHFESMLRVVKAVGGGWDSIDQESARGTVKLPKGVEIGSVAG